MNMQRNGKNFKHLWELFQKNATTKLMAVRRSYYPHAIIVLVTIVTIVLMFPREKSYEFADLKEGEIYIGEQVVAPFTFSIEKDPEEYNRDVEAARRSVPPLFVRVDTVANHRMRQLRGLLTGIESILTSVLADSLKAQQLSDLLKSYQIAASEEMIRFFLQTIRFPEPKARKTKSRKAKRVKKATKDTLQAQGIQFTKFQSVLIQITRDMYSIGVLNISPNDLPNQSEKIAIAAGTDEIIEKTNFFHNLSTLDITLLQKLREQFENEQAVKAGFEILSQIIRPNIFYDEEQTQKRIEEAVKRVPKFKGTVLAKEKIIDSHEKITREHIQKLRSLAKAKAEREGQSTGWAALMPGLGKVLMASVGLMFILAFLYYMRRPIFDDPKKVTMIFISILLVLFIGHFISKFSLSEYLIPVAIAAMLLTIFFDAQVAFMGMVSLAILLAGLRGNEFSITLISLVVGIASILSVRKVRSRSWLFKSFIWVATGYIVSIGTLELLRYSDFTEVTNSLLYGLINGFLSPILTYGLMVIFEYTFDMTTDATLLELSDLNKPLLRQLAIRAPGTYHHSILVGSLAEAAAEAIGANSLLARVGAYYHDIGKMEKPEYFVENQVDGKNPHEKLSPSMSCLILVSHVKRGLEIAQEYGLPKEIQNFISEHHGTTLISYFYNKAKEMSDGKEVNEDDFRYPGPKPQSKETGIVMLADAVEAASRSMKDPSVSRLRSVVNAIIDDRFKSCELDESPLTLRDLNQIQEAFVTILTGVFHGRVEYPDQDEKLLQHEHKNDKQNAQTKADGEAV